MAEKALTDDNLEEEDVCCAAKLLEIILQNCRGRIDACVPGYLALVLRRLPTARKKLFQVFTTIQLPHALAAQRSLPRC